VTSRDRERAVRVAKRIRRGMSTLMARGSTSAVVLAATSNRGMVENGRGWLEEFLELKAIFGYASHAERGK